MGPAIIVFPDCFTALGGNQYVNSSAIGRYADYLVDEIVPFVDREFRTLASREHRGCFGKSSGGYGAMIHGMKYTAHWGAIANHSGDAYFDFLYRADWPNTLNELAKYRRPARKAGPVSAPRDTAAERSAARRASTTAACAASSMPSGRSRSSRSAEAHAIMNVCMAATYDPDPARTARLPAAVPPRHRRAAASSAGSAGSQHDPVLLVTRHARATCAGCKGIYIDCGWRDQYQIHFGTRQLSRRLAAAGIAHRYEEFDDDSLGRRLPHGREPAVPLPRTAAVTRPRARPRTRQRLGARLGAHRRPPRAGRARARARRAGRRVGRRAGRGVACAAAGSTRSRSGSARSRSATSGGSWTRIPRRRRHDRQPAHGRDRGQRRRPADRGAADGASPRSPPTSTPARRSGCAKAR